MGQKVNPLGFRLGFTQEHKSRWFEKVTRYSELSVEDFFLRKITSKKFLESKIIEDAKILEIEIQREQREGREWIRPIQIKIQAAKTTFNPKFLTGSKLEKLIKADKKKENKEKKFDKLDKLKKEIEKELHIFRNNNFFFYKTVFFEKEVKPQISLRVIQKYRPNLEAAFLAEFLVEEIQKRTPFRRAVKQTTQRTEKQKEAKVEGIKIQISGRLNGAEIARTEWIRQGRVPLQTLRATIDYSYRTAKTIYGIIGIKIWVFKG